MHADINKTSRQQNDLYRIQIFILHTEKTSKDVLFVLAYMLLHSV